MPELQRRETVSLSPMTHLLFLLKSIHKFRVVIMDYGDLQNHNFFLIIVCGL